MFIKNSFHKYCTLAGRFRKGQFYFFSKFVGIIYLVRKDCTALCKFCTRDNTSKNHQGKKAIALCLTRIIILLTDFIVLRIDKYFGLLYNYFRTKA